MAEKLHSELTSVDLHGSKIPILTTMRSPAFDGEIAWVGGQFQVGIGSTWRSVASSGFSWVLQTKDIFNPSEFVNLAIEVYHQDAPALEAAQNPFGFSFYDAWRDGLNWSSGMPIDLTPIIQSRGIGSYVAVVTGEDQYGAPGQPLSSNIITVQQQSPASAVQLWDSDLDFQGDSGALYSGFTGFSVAAGFASVVLSIEMRP